MTQFFHKTNNSSSSAPNSSQIAQGEICINNAILGNSSSGIHNGRIYIKLNNDEIRRFVSLGVPGSSDPALKTKYGGTNNDFSSASANTETGYDSLMVFKVDGNGNHYIDKTAADSLTWNGTEQTFNINRSAAAQATLHVGGTFALDNITPRTDPVDTNTYILAANDTGSWFSLQRISGPDFFTLFANDSISTDLINGPIPIAKGGTGADLTDPASPSDGAIFYYDSANSKFITNADLKWNAADSCLELDAPEDTTDAAEAVGIDAGGKLVKLTTANFDKVVIAGGTGAGNTLVLTSIDESSSGGTALEIDIAGNVYKASSTIRVKENITDYTRGLNEVLSLSPKTFNMINDSSKTLRAGLIAEDLDSLGLNEFVVKDSDGQPSAINYDKLVVLLINAIKELKQQIDSIK